MSELMWLIEQKCRTSLLRRLRKCFQGNDMNDTEPQIQSDVV